MPLISQKAGWPPIPPPEICDPKPEIRYLPPLGECGYNKAINSARF